MDGKTCQAEVRAMEFAVIADIHGNHLALETVLADIDARGIKHIVNLGDSFSGPLQADKTADLLFARPILTVCGNHDRYLIERTVHGPGSWETPILDQMSPAILNFIHALPFSAVFEDIAYLCHASPLNDKDDWLEHYENGRPVGTKPLSHIEGRAKGVNFPVLLCAHSHIARLVQLDDGRLIVNPGSVGCPAFLDDSPGRAYKLENNNALAAYATIRQGQNGFDVAFHKIAYDNMTMAKLAADRGFSDWADALSTGRIRQELQI
jgi:predicted phosphodiesterase